VISGVSGTEHDPVKSFMVFEAAEFLEPEAGFVLGNCTR